LCPEVGSLNSRGDPIDLKNSYPESFSLVDCSIEIKVLADEAVKNCFRLVNAKMLLSMNRESLQHCRSQKKKPEGQYDSHVFETKKFTDQSDGKRRHSSQL
jgi:hypothetical protein